MSRKTELQADLARIGYQLGRAHLTRQSRSGIGAGRSIVVDYPCREREDILQALGYVAV